ncbi:hypothetical protein FNV43_RR12317 [Rhamnella rubrinervis]|uniref:Uncharacterized protein n=1 Tax=Rhamnella rubrinervis TaxID=2594499 RepID=A0A8K0H752_9ROSA|nr:hypothetical protein FNV43_RR12317 [Rhamnella rubrinervis]
MATLQRSAFSFRRKGSSGVVWDDKFMNGEFRERDHHEGNAEYRELRPCQSARTSFVGINELSGSNVNAAEPSSAGVNFKRSFSTAAPKKQAFLGGKLFRKLPVGFGRSESMIKKSN